MTKRFWLSILFAIILFSNATFADTYEFLTFTPPSGWTKQTATDGVVYRRPTGVGLVTVYSGQPASDTAEREFAKMWAEKIEPAVSIKAPVPAIETDGDYRVAIGSTTVDAQGNRMGITLMTIVRKGRVVGLSAVFVGEDVGREIAPFFLSIKLEGSVGPNGGRPGGATNTIDLDFEVPAGYSLTRDGNMQVMKPNVVDRATPCVYGVSPSRPSKGNAETDARDALLEPLPGWQVKGNNYSAMRGKSADGWDYLWLRTDVQRPGPSYQYLSAMSMAVEMDGGRVGIVWGFGDPAHCLANDIHFARLFASLKVRGWVSDGGRGLMKQLAGTWRNTEYAGMAQYRFLANGRYEYGQGTSTTFGNLETRTGSVGDGGYAVQGSRLVLTGGKRAGTYLMRVYEEYSGGTWLKTISLVNTGSNPPLEVRYIRVQ